MTQTPSTEIPGSHYPSSVLDAARNSALRKQAAEETDRREKALLASEVSSEDKEREKDRLYLEQLAHETEVALEIQGDFSRARESAIDAAAMAISASEKISIEEIRKRLWKLVQSREGRARLAGLAEKAEADLQKERQIVNRRIEAFEASLPEILRIEIGNNATPGRDVLERAVNNLIQIAVESEDVKLKGLNLETELKRIDYQPKLRAEIIAIFQEVCGKRLEQFLRAFVEVQPPETEEEVWNVRDELEEAALEKGFPELLVKTRLLDYPSELVQELSSKKRALEILAKHLPEGDFKQLKSILEEPDFDTLIARCEEIAPVIKETSGPISEAWTNAISETLTEYFTAQMLKADEPRVLDSFVRSGLADPSEDESQRQEHYSKFTRLLFEDSKQFKAACDLMWRLPKFRILIGDISKRFSLRLSEHPVMKDANFPEWVELARVLSQGRKERGGKRELEVFVSTANLEPFEKFLDNLIDRDSEYFWLMSGYPESFQPFVIILERRLREGIVKAILDEGRVPELLECVEIEKKIQQARQQIDQMKRARYQTISEEDYKNEEKQLLARIEELQKNEQDAERRLKDNGLYDKYHQAANRALNASGGPRWYWGPDAFQLVEIELHRRKTQGATPEK